jgi:hypothetical protein
MTSFAEQSQQIPAIRDGVKSISRYISAKRKGEKIIRLTVKVKSRVQLEGYTVNHYLRTFMVVTVLPFTKKLKK